MSTQYHITLSNAEGNRSTMVVLDDGIFWDTWNQSILGPAMLIGSGSGSWDYFGAARVLNLWDGASDRKILQMRRVPGSLRRGDSGEGLFQGKSQILDEGVIGWRVTDVVT